VRLHQLHHLRPAADAIRQPSQIAFGDLEAAGIGTARKEQSDRDPGGGMEHQGAPFHPLGPALLLIPRALEPAVHRHDLRHRQPLSIHHALGVRLPLARVHLRHPHARGAVGTAQPLQRGIRQQMRRDARRDPRRTATPAEQPGGSRAEQGAEQQHQEAHRRSHPLRRNQR
jgi:hypothetical protein